MANPKKALYPRTGDQETVYLKDVITKPNITVGEYTIYNDFVNGPNYSRRTTRCTTTPSITIS